MRVLRLVICTWLLAVLSLPSYANGFISSVDGYRFDQGDAKLSPDGKYLALAMLKEGRRSLVVVQTDGFNAVGGANFGRWQDVGNFHWVTSERLVMEILHREEWDDNPKSYGELLTVKYNGKHSEMVYGYRAGEKQVGSKRKRKESIYGWGRIISLMENDDEDILISSTDMPGGSELFEDRQKRNLVRTAQVEKLFSTVHRLNLKTNRMSSSTTRSPEPNSRFITNYAGELMYAYGGEPGQQVKMYRFQNDEWQLMNIGNGESFLPIAFNRDRTQLQYLDNHDGEVGCLLSMQLSSQKISKLHETCDLSPEQLVLDVERTNVYAIHQNSEDAPYLVLDPSSVEADFFAQIVDLFTGQKVDVHSRSKDGQYWIVKTQSENNQFSFYLYSTKSNEFTQII